MVKYSILIGQVDAHCLSGVDALNVALEVVLFAATMNLGQGWKTILVLFGCKGGGLMDCAERRIADEV